MRGGTSKGVFFRLQDLPESAQEPGRTRDRLLARIIGSPDPYAKHIDGMGGATSSTSKVVIVSESTRPNHDVDYLFGQLSTYTPHVDWAGNCGNLAAAVGPFAISSGIIDLSRHPKSGMATVRIWQANIHKTIIAKVPMANGEVQEVGDFHLDGVPFPSAEIKLEYVEAEGSRERILPTGNVIDKLAISGIGDLNVTLVNAGIPTVFVNAEDLGYQGTELQKDVNDSLKELKMFEAIRTQGALKMGLIRNEGEITQKQNVPKIAFVARPKDYTTSDGKKIHASNISILVRALSMGKLHHALPGTVSIAVGAAASVPGTIVHDVINGSTLNDIRIGHPSGILLIGVKVEKLDSGYYMTNAAMSRTSRVIMEGWVRVPPDVLL